MRKVIRRAMAVVVALSVWASAAAGQDQPKETVAVGKVSVASIDALNKFIADLGLPLGPSMDIKNGLETAPFLGPNTVVTDKPFGVTVVVGDPHKLFPFQDSVLASVPVVAGKATPADMAAAGGKVVEGTTDTFAGVGGAMILVRRTADYLHIKAGAGTFGLAAMTDGPFAADFKDATNLFVLTANFDTFRKTAPEAYKELAKQVTAFPRMFGITTPDDTKPVEDALAKVDKFTLALGQDDVNLHLKSWYAPSPLALQAKEAPRPAFPAGMIMRMHLVYPTAAAAGLLEKQLAAMPEDAFGMGTPPVYHERIKAAIVKAASLNTRTEAVSVAFAMKGGQPVFYLVDQFNTDVDGVKEIGDLVREGVGLAAEAGGAKVNVESSTYAAGGQNVQRMVLSPEASAAAPGAAVGGAAPAAPAGKIVIDEMQTGRTLYMAISVGPEGKYVAELAGAGMDGKSSVLCAGAVDLGALVTAAAEAGGMPGVSPDMLQKFKTSWAGQGVTWTVQSSEQNFLYTDVQVPKQVIRDLVKMTTSQVVPTEQVSPGLP